MKKIISDIKYLHKLIGMRRTALRNINLDLTEKSQRRILISFLSYEHISEYNKNLCMHTQVQELIQIIKYFISKNFVIDVCSNSQLTNINFLNQVKYDYIFGFGDVFRSAKNKNPYATTILYLTENPPDISYAKEMERIKYYTERTGILTNLVRTNVFFEINDFQISDYVICLGDINFVNHNKKYRLYPTGFYNEKFNFEKKTYTTSFVWMGGSALIHKGLDLCIEIFQKHSDWLLYIAGITKQDMKKIKLHIKTNNIINLGFVNIQSDEFINLVGKTTYVLLPSCSEASATSVLTCMRHGLIPIVTKTMGFLGLEDYFYFLNDYKLEDMEADLIRIITANQSDLAERSRKVYEFANKAFNLSEFTVEFSKIINQIIED